MWSGNPMFNLKMSKKMKKFFSLMLVALVMLGVTACEQNVTIDTPKSEGLSFYAEIAMTRADLEQGANENGNVVWNTIWEVGDELTVTNEYIGSYNFVYCINEEGTYRFYCDDNGVNDLLGNAVTISMNNDSVVNDGKKGIVAEAIVDSFASDMTVTLDAQNAFLRYYYIGDATFTLANNLFTVNGEPSSEIVVPCKGETWVSVLPGTTSLKFSGSANGETKSKDTITFEAGKIYNLGTLGTVSTVTLAGSINDWDAKSTPLFVVGDYYAICGVEFTEDSEFKLVNNGSWCGASNFNINKWSQIFNGGGDNISIAKGTYDFYFSNDESLLVVVEAGSEIPETVEYRTIYLNTGGSSMWNQANAYFTAWVWGSSVMSDVWCTFESVGDGIYSTNVPKDATGAKFLRKDPSTVFYTWDNWNQTDNLTLSSDKNLYTITGWGGSDGYWSVYSAN